MASDIPTWASVPKAKDPKKKTKRPPLKDAYAQNVSVGDLVETLGALFTDTTTESVLPPAQQAYNMAVEENPRGTTRALDAQFSNDRPTLAAEGGNTLNDAVFGTRYSNSANPPGALQEQPQQPPGPPISDEQIQGILAGPEKQMFPDVSNGLPPVDDRSIRAPEYTDLSTMAPQEDRDRYAESQKGALEKFGDWLGEGNRSEKLLRFGQGMLSENEWYSGLGAGAGGIADVMASERKTNAAMNAGGGRRYATQNWADKDGHTVSYRWDKKLGVHETRDDEGNWVPVDPNAEGRSQVNNSFATTGALNGAQMKDVWKDMGKSEKSLQTYDRLLDIYAADKYEGGIGGAYNALAGYLANIEGAELTEEQALQLLARGDEQAIIGAMRLDKLGPGPVTEADAVRLAQAAGQSGWDAAILRAMANNPQLASEQLQEARRVSEMEYKFQHQMYTKGREHMANANDFPDRPFYTRESGREDRERHSAEGAAAGQRVAPASRHTSGGALAQPVELTPDSAKSLKVGDPVTWKGEVYKFAGFDDNGQPILE